MTKKNPDIMTTITRIRDISKLCQGVRHPLAQLQEIERLAQALLNAHVGDASTIGGYGNER